GLGTPLAAAAMSFRRTLRSPKPTGQPSPVSPLPLANRSPHRFTRQLSPRRSARRSAIQPFAIPPRSIAAPAARRAFPSRTESSSGSGRGGGGGIAVGVEQSEKARVYPAASSAGGVAAGTGRSLTS